MTSPNLAGVGSKANLQDMEIAVRSLISAAGLELDDQLLASTPQRVALTFAELFAGVGWDARKPLLRGDTVPEGVDLVALNEIEFRSICAHHLLPFSGKVSVVYRPVERVVGIGSIIRTLEILSARPQLQEILTQQLAQAIMEGTGASGSLVLVEARHSCIADRGPREASSNLRTLASVGDLAEEARRHEALAYLVSSFPRSL